MFDWALERTAYADDLVDRDVTQKLGERCCKWITEAHHLIANGMPAGSFSLTLDGDPAPDQSTDLFELVKEDAAWQTALSQRYAEESWDLTFIQIRRGGIFFSEVFPQAIQDIVEGKSFVRCKFLLPEVLEPHPEEISSFPTRLDRKSSQSRY